MITLEVFYKGEKLFEKKSLSKDYLDKYKDALKMMVYNIKDLKFVWKL